MKSARTYRTVCISLYVEELVALDAKVEALKAAGINATRSRLVALAVKHIDDDVLVAMLRPFVPVGPAKRMRAMRARRRVRAEDYSCGACAIKGHNRRSCQGREREEQRQ